MSTSKSNVDTRASARHTAAARVPSKADASACGIVGRMLAARAVNLCVCVCSCCHSSWCFCLLSSTSAAMTPPPPPRSRDPPRVHLPSLRHTPTSPTPPQARIHVGACACVCLACPCMACATTSIATGMGATTSIATGMAGAAAEGAACMPKVMLASIRLRCCGLVLADRDCLFRDCHGIFAMFAICHKGCDCISAAYACWPCRASPHHAHQ